MDYIRQLGPVVLAHRLRRMTETLLMTAEEIYDARGLPFRGRWASTYQLLYAEGPLAVGQIADRLRLTHPGVIGITDEMIAVDVITAVRDPGDARRRMLDLTPRGRNMSNELFAIWKEFGEAQKRRFTAAGCDIMEVLRKVEDGMQERSLSSEVLERIAKKSGKPKRAAAVRRAARVSMLLLVSAAIAANSVDAQTPQPRSPQPQQTATPIDAAAKAALVNALSDSLINGYIYEKTGRTLADSLRAELSSGAYNGFDTGESFAQRVNQTLKRIANDRHLGVQYAPVSNEPQRMRVRVPPGGMPSSVAPNPSDPNTIIFREYGIGPAQILPGNIGYVRIIGFSGDSGALAAIDSVMKMFQGTKAIIIDVGQNRGGGPLVIEYLSGYLFDKPTHLVSSFMRGMDAPSERWTSKTVNGKRIPKTPVYVLTSKLTISAAESFAFGLRNHKRITLVGEPTAGGGHFGGFVNLTPGFSVFLPRGRTYNPATNEGWEAEGLKPDIAVPYDKALETALDLARKL